MKRISRTAKALILISIVYLLSIAALKHFHVPGAIEIAQAVFLVMLFVALKLRRQLRI